MGRKGHNTGRKGYILLFCLFCGSLAAENGFVEGTPIELAGKGGIFAKPSYSQAGKAVPTGAVDAFLRYDYRPATGSMEEAARFDTAHVITAVGGAALLVGGFATFAVAASGVSDRDGTTAIYFTSAGLFLGSAGSWLGNWYCQDRRVAARRRALALYNESLVTGKAGAQ